MAILNRLFIFCLLVICVIFIFNIDIVESFGTIQPEDIEVYMCYFREQFTNLGGFKCLIY